MVKKDSSGAVLCLPEGGHYISVSLCDVQMEGDRIVGGLEGGGRVEGLLQLLEGGVFFRGPLQWCLKVSGARRCHHLAEGCRSLCEFWEVLAAVVAQA